jgi:hypothetical protein
MEEIMTDRKFKKLMSEASTMLVASLVASPDYSAYWNGFIRGLRRAHHGERFGTAREHQKWLSLVSDRDKNRQAMGRGYRNGLKGKMVLE